MRVATATRLPLVASIASIATFAAVVGAGLASCSIGKGTTTGITGFLDVPGCWSGQYSLEPDFYAAVPYLDTLELRIQKGGDYETFSDGIEILIDDTTKIIPNEYGEPLAIGLPAGVTPLGVPLAANPNPPNVHLSLYLQATCQIQDVALYALESVTLNPEGTCDIADGGPAIVVCPGSTSGLLAGDDAGGASVLDGGVPSSGDAGVDGGGLEAGAPQPIGHSSITFTSLFDGNENAVSAAERLNQGTFTVYLADPREMCPGGVGPPPPCRGSLHGNFSFEFEEGRPAQPFP